MQAPALRHARAPRPAPAAARARAGRALRPRLLCQAAGPGGAPEDVQRAAAKLAVDATVRPGSVVGIGTGEMVNYAVEYLAQQAAKGALAGVVAVPSCALSASEAAFQGLKMGRLEQYPKVDVFIEQVDQLDANANAFLKGLRAPAPGTQPDLPALSRLLGAAGAVVLLADAADCVSGRLRAALPVAIDAEAWEECAEEIDTIFLGDAEVWRRPAEGTSNPRGGDNPYVSPDGHAIVDVRFYEGLKLYGEDASYERIEAEVAAIPGVLATGLVVGRASLAVIADAERGPLATPLQPTAAPAAAGGGGS